MIAVVGLGYVGLPLALALNNSGHRVLGFDSDVATVQLLTLGKSHICDIQDVDVAESLNNGFRVTGREDDLRECSVFIICVPTPLRPSGVPDTTYISRAVESIAPWIKDGSLVILESTSYPGTTEELVAQPLEEATGLMAGADFCVAYSPERVDPGNQKYGVSNTPKIVAGLRECCRDRASGIYGAVTSAVVTAKGVREAELAKLLENTYRQVNIALMNEMARFCGPLDIDLYDAIRCAATKPFGFEAFYPGPGVGGHCIPIDPQFLASRVESQLGYSFQFVRLAQQINESMPRYVVDRLIHEVSARGRGIGGKTILLLGIAYKADVPDVRETPAADIVRYLREVGARVVYFDPFVPLWSVDGEPVAALPDLEVLGQDFPLASILVTDHSAFSRLDTQSLGLVVVDTRAQLNGENVVRL